MALFELMTRPNGFSINPADGGVSTLRDKVHHINLSLAIKFWARGDITRTQLENAFGLNDDDKTDLTWLKTKYDASIDKAEFMGRFFDITQAASMGLFNLNNKANYIAAINAIVI